MKILALVSRILLGIVFTFSGFVKAVDPLGSAYKFTDYFRAFDLAWLESISLPMSFLLSAAEFMVGFGLLLGVWLPLMSWGAIIFMTIFTPLTLYIAIANPVSDCGCFGDALVIGNWETFFKNVLFLLPTLYLFLNRKRIPSNYSFFPQSIAFVISLAIITGVSYHSYRHLPIFDFRPYKIGTHILSEMEYPEGAPQDEFEIQVVYAKDGMEQSFALDNLPDSTWQWVRTENRLIKKGYEPPIHDFIIESMNGEDKTSYYLSYPGYTFMMVAYDLEKTALTHMQEINELAEYCQVSGHEFIGLTSSVGVVEDFSMRNDLYFEFYTMDEITLKTMVRANPGFLVLKEGVIIDKFHANDLPAISDLKGDLASNFITKHQQKSNQMQHYSWILLGLLLISLLNHFTTKR